MLLEGFSCLIEGVQGVHGFLAGLSKFQEVVSGASKGFKEMLNIVSYGGYRRRGVVEGL